VRNEDSLREKWLGWSLELGALKLGLVAGPGGLGLGYRCALM